MKNNAFKKSHGAFIKSNLFIISNKNVNFFDQFYIIHKNYQK